MHSLDQLKSQAIQQTIFQPTTLAQALDRLQFVQADPIRFPARAQDLILRHRVADYGVNDLEKAYPKLDLEEGYLYAYGFMPQPLWLASLPASAIHLTKLDRQILELLKQQPSLHPKHIAEQLGHTKVTNAWGGFSRSTKESLEKLHHYGFIRVSRRQNGLRIYDSHQRPPKDQQAKRQLVMAILNLLSPVAEITFSQALAGVRQRHGDTRSTLTTLEKEGLIVKQTIEATTYLIGQSNPSPTKITQAVRFLAPFDPIVWDRRRFEQCWGWPYRFEAYVPPAKRQRGYYALPLLYGENVIGWANAINQPSGLTVEVGLVDKQPENRVFEHEVEFETERLAQFLSTSVSSIIYV